MDMSCAAVKEILPAYVREGDGSLSVRRHLSRCAGCRTDLAHYEEMLGALSAMEATTAPVPLALRTSVVNIPVRAGRLESVRSHVTQNRKAYVSGAAVLVAGAVGAVAWKARKPATA